jgi:hypothetical protein
MKTIIALIKSSRDEWEEDFQVSSLATAEDDVKEIIKRFNAEEKVRYGSKANIREFVRIVGQGGDTCNWQKHTQCDEYGDVVFKCDVCGLVYKIPHASLNSPPKKPCYPNRVCRLCNREYASENNLQNHKRRKHETRR